MSPDQTLSPKWMAYLPPPSVVLGLTFGWWTPDSRIPASWFLHGLFTGAGGMIGFGLGRLPDTEWLYTGLRQFALLQTGWLVGVGLALVHVARRRVREEAGS